MPKRRHWNEFTFLINLSLDNSSLNIKKVSQRIAPSEDFYCSGNLEFEDVSITYCLFYVIKKRDASMKRLFNFNYVL